MIRDEEVYQIGVITRTHCIRGEVAMSFTDDVWDRAEADYLVLRIEGILVPFFMEEYRFRSNETALMKFEGIDDADTAAELTGCDVFFPRSMADDAPDDEVSVAEIIGYDVVDANSGQRVGAITRIDDATMNTLFEVETPDGRLVDLPANAELVKDISRQTRTVTLVIPDGVMDL